MKADDNKSKSRKTKIAHISDDLKSRIVRGELKPEERLPSEEKLGQIFGVSVGTVQKALGELTHQGLILRQHGRGTFVARTRRPQTELQYLTFRDRGGRDLPLFVHVHSVKSIHGRGPWSEFLGGSSSFIRIERMINVGGVFEIFSQFVLREDEFAAVHDMSPQQLAQKSLREILRLQFDLPTLRMEQHIHFDRIPEGICRLLGMHPQSTGLVMELFGYTIDDRSLCYQRLYSDFFDATLVVAR